MKKEALRIGFLILSTFLGLAIVEVGLRTYHPQGLGIWYKTRDDLIILRPNYRGIARGVETVQEIQTNSFGMRDREHQIEPEAGTVRILLLGDSHMEALQMKFERSFVKLLEDKLNALLEQKVEVINAAVSGWGTDEQVTYLNRYGKRFKPNLVLLAMTLHNDIADNLEQNFHTFAEDKLAPKSIQETPFVAYKFWQVKAFLGSHFHAYQFLRDWWHSSTVEAQGRALNTHVAGLLRKRPPEEIAKGWKMTHQLVKKLGAGETDIDAQLAIFLIPLSIQLDEYKLAAFLADHKLSKNDIVLDNPQQIMKEFGDKERIKVIDLLPCFRAWEKAHKKALFLKYDGHWTTDGHELASTVVAQALITNAVLDLPRIQRTVRPGKAERQVASANCNFSESLDRSHQLGE